MSNKQAKRETMSIDQATVSNMWEIAAIIELQEQKRLCTKRAPIPSSKSYAGRTPRHESLRRPSLSRTSSRKPRKRLSATA